MRFTSRYVLALICALAAAVPARAQDIVSVDVGSVVADVSQRPIGINLNYLLDDDGNRPAALRGIAAALREAGVKYLRYPGGEKADGYLWSVPPYTSSIPTLARWAPQDAFNREWPSSDPALVQADGRTFKTNPLTFDEFMAICREIDCVPTIVICYDSMYKPAQPGGVAPTKALLLEAAREWVRYSNVTMGYGVRFWEIGNESYLQSYNGGATASDYARDIVEFAQVMKAVDPSIRIGANGYEHDWWRVVLSEASRWIDFLAVHSYPAYGWGSYSYYQNNPVDLMPEVRIAQQALDTFASPEDRSRIGIAVTEMNSADWTGTWPHVNTLGHAIVVFDILGELFRNPRVEFAQLWNTRWSGNDTATTPSLWDAFDRHNNLQATGRATAIWAQFLQNQVVASSSTASLKTFASYSPQTNRATVFLINKSSAPRSATVTVHNLATRLAADEWVFTGNGPEDVHPTWTHKGLQAALPNVLSISVAPVSITVLDISPSGSITRVPGRVEAEDFDEGDFFDTTPSNEGGAYRSTPVDIESTADSGGGYNVGWIDAGEWLGYTIDVAASGTYALTARVASPVAGAAFRLLLDGIDITGAVQVPNTGGWQSWQTVQRDNITLPAGVHRLTFVAETGWFNLNWIAFQPATPSSAHGVPGVIQAEDFDEGDFFDTTPSNEGGAYRSTPVDIEPAADTGGGYNVGWIDAGEWLGYTIDAASGTYALTARVASPVAGSAFRLLLDGVDITGIVQVPNTGGWQSWQTVKRDNITLPAGVHRLTFVAETGWFNLNWIAFQPAAPSAAQAVPGRIEAEDFNEGDFFDTTPSNEGGAYRSTPVDIEPTADSGGGYNVGWIDAGEWLGYTIDVAASGTYALTARVASPVAGSAFRLLLDGVDITGIVQVPNTGGWQSWQTVQRDSITLTAGVHRLTFVAETGWFNLNWIAFQPASPSAAHVIHGAIQEGDCQ